jgi:hypothetical protein
MDGIKQYFCYAFTSSKQHKTSCIQPQAANKHAGTEEISCKTTQNIQTEGFRFEFYFRYQLFAQF